MKFIDNIDEKKYDEFVENNVNGHFLQSYLWGEFSRLEKNFIPHYVGMIDDKENLCATALLLEKKLPLGLSYFYIPRGPVIDYDNNNLLSEFIREIKKYSKKYRAIFIKIDPSIEINKIDYLGNNVKIKHDKSFVKQFEKIGFHHLGFTKNFETMQPRYSFRIDNSQPLDEVINHFSKTTKQRINKANELNAIVKIGDYNDLETFYNLMIITENRKDFITHDLKYYQTLYKLGEKKENCKLFLGSIDLNKMIDSDNIRLKELKDQEEELSQKKEKSKKENVMYNDILKNITKLEDDLDKYKKYQKEYGNEITLSAHFIISYGDKAWVLYAGNHNILSETYVNYLTYLKHISYYHDKVKIYDQFGTIGDLRKENHLIGLHEFKKKFGGDYTEFIGEFDLIIKPIYYTIFTKLVPMYRKIVRLVAIKKRGEKNGNS